MLVLWILVVFYIQDATSYEEEYKSFHSCGDNGWHCNQSFINSYSVMTVTYRCSPNESGARIWWWTSRIPGPASILEVENCNHVEIHPDCTTGYRPYNLKEFHVRNVYHVEFLEPLRPRVFLHDNARQSHPPPSVKFQNVSKITFTSNIFKNGKAPCRRTQSDFQHLSFDNVILDISTNAFDNVTLQTFSMNNVEIERIESSLSISSDSQASSINITNSRLGNIPGRGFLLRGEQVTITNNILGNVSSSGFIALVGDIFNFENNSIEQVKSDAFKVQAKIALIHSNTWGSIKNNAFRKISPGYYHRGVIPTSKFLYSFVNNEIWSMESGAVNPDYIKYKMVCSEIIVKSNKFPCECPQLSWTPSMNLNNGPFYDLVTFSQNTCHQADECLLEHANALFSRGICERNLTISEVCNSTGNVDISAIFATEDSGLLEYNDSDDINSGHESRYQIENGSVTAQPVALPDESSTNAVVVIIPISILILGAILGYALYLYKKDYCQRHKKREDHSITFSYDGENLIEERL